MTGVLSQVTNSRDAESYSKIGLVYFCMMVREAVPSLAYFTAEWAWNGPAHVHLNMPPHLILLLHHLLTLETLVPRLPLPIPDLRDQLVKP